MGKWRLEGLDTFGGERYPLPGEFDDEDQALAAAAEQMKKIEESQPPEKSGGQDFGGIQDRVYIIHPDGTRHLFCGARIVSQTATQ